LEKIREIKNKIKKMKLVVIVEGKRDKKAVSNLGFKRIITIDGKPIFKILDLLKPKDHVLILTDFDREGKKKAKKLRSLLARRRIKIEEQLRRDFSRFFRIKKIEELNSLFKEASILL